MSPAEVSLVTWLISLGLLAGTGFRLWFAIKRPNHLRLRGLALAGLPIILIALLIVGTTVQGMLWVGEVSFARVALGAIFALILGGELAVLGLAWRALRRRQAEPTQPLLPLPENSEEAQQRPTP